MAGLIKGQILKHLSKFTKNLSPDKLNVSALKGEGELSNLELNEVLLMELLDLPSWLKLSKAVCNKVAIRIQWTRLGSQPICLYMDEVTVDMETTEEPRVITPSAAPSYSSGGKYGFVEKIVDGIYLSVNSVVVNFKSIAFAASIQLSRVTVQSKTPVWLDADLPLTRLKDELGGEVLVFKQAEWQTLRVEANALSGGAGGAGDPLLATTPLRLIANQSKIRITLKKRLADCAIVSSRLQVNLDDLLWVLTDSQLTAALSFANALREIVARSSELSKSLATEKIKNQTATLVPANAPTSLQHRSTGKAQQQQQNQQQQLNQQQQRQGSESQRQKAAIFSKYNIRETSYHVHTGRIDLHLCDDASPDGSSYQRKVDGGAIQLVFSKLEFDFYPLHRAGASREHWLKYNHDDCMETRKIWAAKLLEDFRQDVKTVREAYTANNNRTVGASAPAAPPAPPVNSSQLPSAKSSSFLQTDSRASHPPAPSIVRPVQNNSLGGAAGGATGGSARTPPVILESCVVVRLEDFALYRVSSERRRSAPRRFFASDKKTLLLPSDMSSVYLEHTEYYMADEKHFPLPHSNMYIMINPICLNIDYLTILWLNSFALNLAKKASEIPTDPPSRLHVDIRVDALMPRIVIPSTDAEPNPRVTTPDGLQVQMSKVMATNSRTDLNKSSHSDLVAVLELFERGRLFETRSTDSPLSFPHESDDWTPLASQFRLHSDCRGGGGAWIDPDIGAIFLHNHPAPALSDNWMRAGVLSANQAREELFVEHGDTKRQLGAEAGAGDSAPGKLTTPSDPSYFGMTADSLRLNVDSDVWCVAIEMLWLDFVSLAPSAPGGAMRAPQPFVESVPITLWVTWSAPAEKPSKEGGKKNDFRANLMGAKTELLIDDRNFNKLKSRGDDFKNEDAGDPLPPLEADMHALVTVDAKVRVQLTHAQFCLLMTLVDTVKQYKDEMEADAAAIMSPHGTAMAMKSNGLTASVDREKSNMASCNFEKAMTPGEEKKSKLTGRENIPEGSPDARTLLWATVGEVEISLLFPPLPVFDATNQGKNLRQGGEGGEGSVSPREGGSGLESPNHDIDSGVEIQNTQVPPQESIHVPDASFDSALSLDHSTPSVELLSFVDLEIALQALPPPISELTGGGHGGGEMGGGAEGVRGGPGGMRNAHSSSELSVHTTGGGGEERTEAEWEMLNVSVAKSGPSEIKKSFSQAFTSLSKLTDRVIPAMTQKQAGRQGDDPDASSLSGATSDDDDDSSLYERLEHQAELPAFEHSRGLGDDEGSLVGSLGGAEGSEGTCKRPAVEQMVSVLVLRLGGVEAVAQACGKDVSVLATVDHIRCEELGNHQLERFQAAYISGGKDATVWDSQTPSCPIARVRFELGRKADSAWPGCGEVGHLRLVAEGLTVRLLSSSLTNLAEMFEEDDKVPEILPMDIDASDIRLTLIDDKLPVYGSIPKMAPVDLHVHRAVIRRDGTGVFHIAGLDPHSHVNIKRASTHSDISTFPQLHSPSPSSNIQQLAAASGAPITSLHSSSNSANNTPSDQSDALIDFSADTLTNREALALLRLENDSLRNHLAKQERTKQEQKTRTKPGSGVAAAKTLSGDAVEAAGAVAPEAAHEVVYEMAHGVAREVAREVVQALKAENAGLVAQLARQARELDELRLERASLHCMLQQLQEDLSISEKRRTRTAP